MSDRHLTICIDLDDTIRDMKTNEAIPGAIEAIDKLQKADYEVVVLTANDEKFANTWLLEHWEGDTQCPQATNTKVPAIAYIDDRAIRFTNWKDVTKHFI